jgi:hypothetical protein
MWLAKTPWIVTDRWILVFRGSHGVVDVGIALPRLILESLRPGRNGRRNASARLALRVLTTVTSTPRGTAWNGRIKARGGFWSGVHAGCPSLDSNLLEFALGIRSEVWADSPANLL